MHYQNHLLLIVLKRQVRKRESKPPFITSTLQQEASSKLGFKARKTMMIAQKLYEGVQLEDETVGLITYMRTDSTRLSDVFVESATNYIKEKYGANYVGKVKISKKKKMFKMPMKEFVQQVPCVHQNL